MKKFQTAINQNFTIQLQFRHSFNRLLLCSMFFFSFLLVSDSAAASSDRVMKQAPEVIKGDWFIDFGRKEPDQVQLTLLKRKIRGDKYTYSAGARINEIQGLSKEFSAIGEQRDVQFRIVREAGTFEMQGIFRDGKGAGFLTLTPNRDFVSAMNSRGYGNLTEDDLYAAATNDLSVKTVDDLKSAGYDRLSFKDLIEADIFKLSSEYIRELKSAGYENLPFKDLVEARVFKIDSQFAKEIQAAGFPSLPFKSLIEMRVFKITPEFIRSARNRLGNDLTVKQILDLRRLGIINEPGRE